jgi:DNA-binding CsgD family transcriptional regulator
MSNGRGRGVHLACASLDLAEEVADAPFLLLFRPPEPDLRTLLSIATNIFGLTGAEAQTMAQILDDRSLDEAMAILGVARSTVKSHMDSIFAKIDTHRQTELASQVMGLAATVR